MEPKKSNHFSAPQFGWGRVGFARGSTTLSGKPAVSVSSQRQAQEKDLGCIHLAIPKKTFQEEVIEIG